MLFEYIPFAFFALASASVIFYICILCWTILCGRTEFRKPQKGTARRAKRDDDTPLLFGFFFPRHIQGEASAGIIIIIIIILHGQDGWTASNVFAAVCDHRASSEAWTWSISSEFTTLNGSVLYKPVSHVCMQVGNIEFT